MERSNQQPRQQRHHDNIHQSQEYSRINNHQQQMQDYPPINPSYYPDCTEYMWKKTYLDIFTGNDSINPLGILSQLEDPNQPNLYQHEYYQHRTELFQDPNQIVNPHNTLTSLLWHQNNQYHQLLDMDIKKQQNQKPWNPQYQVKNQPIQDIAHYIDQINHGQFINRKLIQSKTQKYQYNSEEQLIKNKQLRKQKVQKYLQKKKKRCYLKKITYQCRKLVADKRIRLKGRFINYNQAIKQLRLDPKQNYQCQYLKQLIKNQEGN